MACSTTIFLINLFVQRGEMYYAAYSNTTYYYNYEVIFTFEEKKELTKCGAVVLFIFFVKNTKNRKN